MKQLSEKDIERIYHQALQDGRIDDSDTSVFFYSKEILLDRLSALKDAFPSNTLHAIAIKANSSPEVLKIIADEGFGLEAASFEEVLLAVEAGVPYEKIVFDSPVKTRSEIQACNERFPGMKVNANCLEELERYPKDFSGRLGIRINPLVASDAPDMWNVSQRASKFGVDIRRERDILAACTANERITGVHLHVGSGIKDFDANVEAIQKVTALAAMINEARIKTGNTSRISWIDIGGGILFGKPGSGMDLSSFVERIRSSTTLLDDFDVITEYGKFIHNDAGFVVSDIEYVTYAAMPEEPDTAFIHAGADLFVRKVYSDLPIHFPFSVIRSQSEVERELRRYNIAGPLCFAGDFLYHHIELPQLCEDDKFVIHRTGANTLSMWSRHCSRKEPKLIVV